MHVHAAKVAHAHAHTRAYTLGARLAPRRHDATTGEVRVGIFALRDVAPGEELVYDYAFQHYGAMRQNATSFACMCGAKNCRCVLTCAQRACRGEEQRRQRTGARGSGAGRLTAS